MKDDLVCSHCGELIEDEDYGRINGEVICSDCIERYCTTCERCGSLMWDSDSYGDDYTVLCRSCYENHYTRCYECDALIHNDDSYEYDGEYYCRECYDNVCCGDSIHDYNYKPEPIFYGDGSRYFGVELEIDIGGKDCAYADEILAIANDSDDHIYIKSDGSLNDGMEIVTHPMTLEYHKEFCWKDIMRKAVSLGYRSHQTSTCGLHVHVNRNSFGETSQEQEEVISRILYFVEHHWLELLKFSRRSEATMNRWAARYGYESTPKAIMDKAKKNCCGRYAAVNLCNYHTVEFRMFRGTLKYNTLIAALQLVNEICDAAFSMSDEEMQKLSWSEFVAGLNALCNLLAPVFEGVFQNIANIFSEISGIILGLLDVFIGLFTGNWSQLWDGVKGIFTSIWNFIVSMFTNILNTLKGIADVVLGWFGTSWNEVWTSIKDFFVNIWTSISTFFTGIVTGIRDFFVNTWTGIYTFFSNIFNAIYTVVSTVFQTIYNTIMTVWNGIYETIKPLLDAFKYLFETIFQAIHIIISNVMDWISEKISAIWNAIVAFITPILEGIKTTFESIWNAIKSVIDTVLGAIQSVITSVWNAIYGFLSPILNSIKSVVSSVWDSISGKISSIMSTIKSTISSIWDNIKSAVSTKVSGVKTAIQDGFQAAVDWIKGLASDAWNWGADIISGIIDGILCKSISRFARNTVDLLETVRHLKALGIEVRFEKENINSMSGDGELMLTILASFAQEESRSISENVKWGIRKRFENGEMCCKNPVLGYEWVDDQLIVVPEEAAIVKRIFQNFLDGKSRLETERELNGEGITTKNGCRWQDSSIKVVLTNITYTGNLLFQKEYITDPITKRRRKNKGELPQYFVEGTHEAIIDMETFQYVQAEMQRRRELGALANKSLNTCCFTGKLKCPFCGQSYMHNTRKDRGSFQEFWSCGAIKKKGGRCPVGGSINHKHLRETCAKVLGLPEFDEEVFLAQVDVILVPARETLEFHLKDGAVITEECKNTGYQECWTPERRAATAKRRRDSAAPNRPDATCFTKKIKCIRCELNYRRGTRKDVHHWRCAGRNGCLSLREEVLKSLTAEVLGLTEFDDDVFLEQISRIEVHDNDMLRYCFYDGRTEERQYIAPPKPGRKWTAHQREVMAQKVSASWTPERRADMSVRAKEMRRREKLAKNN